MRFECCKRASVFCVRPHLDAEILPRFFNSSAGSWTEVTVFLPSPHLSSVISIHPPPFLLLSLSLSLSLSPYFSHPLLPSLLNSPVFSLSLSPSLTPPAHSLPFFYFPPRIWNCQKVRVLSMPEMVHSKLCSFSSSVSAYVLYVRVCVRVYFRVCLSVFPLHFMCVYVCVRYQDTSPLIEYKKFSDSF